MSSPLTSGAIFPPSLPVREITGMFFSWATLIASMTLPELPLVDMARRMSPGFPSALTCFEKISL